WTRSVRLWHRRGHLRAIASRTPRIISRLVRHYRGHRGTHIASCRARDNDHSRASGCSPFPHAIHCSTQSMKANQLGKTLGDYVAIAICPALIMALVGSLVFFLLEVLYKGQYPERLQWVFGWFIFAAVLIARISMDNSGAAIMYGAALGVVGLLCLHVFVE